MPTYDFRCKECDYEFAIIQRMSDERPRVCPQCEGTLRRVIGKPMILPDTAPYHSIVTGEEIGGRTAHREHLARHHLTEVGDQMSKRGREYLENSEFEQRRKWLMDKGRPVPHNLRDLVDGKADG